MSEPGISVVMTTYNGERFLAKQIESILSQTLRPNEIIICDDASTDSTVAILEKYRADHGIVYHINEQRLGVVENFKKAVSLAAAGNYISLSDQDDIWLPEKLERSMAALRSIDDGQTPAMVYSNLTVIDEAGNITSPSLNSILGFDKFEHCLATLVYGNFLLGCTVLMNQKMRSFFPDIPDTGSNYHDTWITLIAFSFGKAMLLPGSYVLYRQHANNVTFANHRPTKRYERVLLHLKNIFGNKDYLLDRVVLLKKFYDRYRSLLTEQQVKDIRTVLDLEGSSYLQKKMAYERSFRGKWINRF